MTKTLIHVAVAGATLLVAGCQTWGPTWSEVSNRRYYDTTTMYLRPAIIERIDDQAAFAQMPIKVDPGVHVIVVQGPYRQPGGGFLKSITVDMEPCKRYYINAQFINNVTPDFEPVVTYVEDLTGCGERVAAK
jgi:hypothetical protein